MSDNYTKDLNHRMDKSLETYKHNISSVRAGRATPDLLNQIKVEAYNDMMPLNQVATISAPDSTTLAVQVWDKENIAKIGRAHV